MGTNYYWHKQDPCPHCNRSYEPLHVGKSCGGWYFSLHVIPESGINDLRDWELLWQKPGSFILDEYGRRITLIEMHSIITDRSWHGIVAWSTAHYLRNQAEPGLNGLVRSALGERCVSHGAGTWDCIVGDFS